MIAEAGLAALWLAATLALLQFVLMIVALQSPVEVARTMRAVAVVQGALTLIAFAALLIVFARTDLSVALVAENSHSA
jgi:cytochrome c-type biogenesis protein CcmF